MVMRGRKGPAPPELHSFLRGLYFGNLWIDQYAQFPCL